MRLIYVDEAGNSTKEPVIVILGVIIEADSQWRSVADEINDVFDRWVPPQFREGFIFHGKEVFSGGKYREYWSFPERLNFFKDFLSIVKRQRLVLCISAAKKENAANLEKLSQIMPADKIEHLLAYRMCVARADRFLRVHTNNAELGVVIVEDSPGMKELLKKVHHALKNDPIVFTPEMLLEGSMNKEGEVWMITNIVDCPHFVDKTDSVMLQLADAFAFAFRRYFTGLTNGEDLLGSVFSLDYLNDHFNKERWTSPCGATLVGW